LISYNSTKNHKRDSRSEISVSGSSMIVENRLKSLCDTPAFEQLKRFNLTKTSSDENIVPSISK